jgi:hypothetical protein
MNRHELKILPQHYANVAAGTKTFEIRNNDRAFQKGDTVVLRCWTGEGYNRFVRHDLSVVNEDLEFIIGDVYPIDAERVVFSLLEPK